MISQLHHTGCIQNSTLSHLDHSYHACLPDVPLLALQRVEELRPEAGEPRVADVEVDARGHGDGEEERL